MKQKVKKVLKNMWLWAFVGVVVLALAVVFSVGKKTERIFAYVPQNIDQAFVVRVDPKNTLLYQNYMQNLPWNIASLFADMDIVVITQRTIDALTQNLIFVQSKPGFEPQALADSMNGSGEVQYIYQKLEENVYVFGMPETLKYLSFDTQKSFFAEEKIKSLSSLLNASEISFFSHVSSNPQVTVLTPFVGGMDYFVYGLDMQGKIMHMEAHLLYKEKKALDRAYRFKPLFAWYPDKNTLLFLELGKLVQQMGIKKETLMVNLQALLPMWGVNTLSSGDYESIYAAMSNNVGILVGEGNNFAGVGLALLFRDQHFFSVLSKIMPVAQSFISALPFLSGAQSALVHDVDKQGFTTQVAGIQDVGLYAEKKWEDTLLTLGDPTLSSDNDLTIDSSVQTLWYFRVQFDPVLALYKRFKTGLAALSPLGQSASQEDFWFFEGKMLQGQIVAREEGVMIEAVLK